MNKADTAEKAVDEQEVIRLIQHVNQAAQLVCKITADILAALEKD